MLQVIVQLLAQAVEQVCFWFPTAIHQAVGAIISPFTPNALVRRVGDASQITEAVELGGMALHSFPYSTPVILRVNMCGNRPIAPGYCLALNPVNLHADVAK